MKDKLFCFFSVFTQEENSHSSLLCSLLQDGEVFQCPAQSSSKIQSGTQEGEGEGSLVASQKSATETTKDGTCPPGIICEAAQREARDTRGKDGAGDRSEGEILHCGGH